jgi:hypothetical protein
MQENLPLWGKALHSSQWVNRINNCDIVLYAFLADPNYMKLKLLNKSMQKGSIYNAPFLLNCHC